MKNLILVLLIVSCHSMADENIGSIPNAPRLFADFQKQIPPGGLISDGETARAIGKAVLESKFGVVAVERHGQLVVRHESDYWVVETPTQFPPPAFGGGYSIVISQRDGRILALAEGR